MENSETNLNPEVPNIEPEQELPKKKKFILPLIILVILILVGGIYYFLSKGVIADESIEYLVSEEFEDSNTIEYVNSDFGFSIKYLRDYILSEEDDGQISILFSQDQQPIILKESINEANAGTGKWGEYTLFHYNSRWAVGRFNESGGLIYINYVEPLTYTESGLPIFNGGVKGHEWAYFNYIVALSGNKFLIVSGPDKLNSSELEYSESNDPTLNIAKNISLISTEDVGANAIPNYRLGENPHKIFLGGSEGANAVQTSDGSKVAIASGEGTIDIYSLETGEKKYIIDRYNHGIIAFMDNDSILYPVSGDEYIVRNIVDDNTIKIKTQRNIFMVLNSNYLIYTKTSPSNDVVQEFYLYSLIDGKEVKIDEDNITIPQNTIGSFFMGCNQYFLYYTKFPSYLGRASGGIPTHHHIYKYDIESGKTALLSDLKDSGGLRFWGFYDNQLVVNIFRSEEKGNINYLINEEGELVPLSDLGTDSYDKCEWFIQ